MADILALKKEYCPASELNAQEKAFCEGYVDQCVAQSSQKSQGESSYEVVSDSGTKVGDMDYLGCLGFATFAGVAHGKPKGAGSKVASENAAPAEKQKTPEQAAAAGSQPTEGKKAVGGYSLNRPFKKLYEKDENGDPLYFTAKISEHASWCVAEELLGAASMVRTSSGYGMDLNAGLQAYYAKLVEVAEDNISQEYCGEHGGLKSGGAYLLSTAFKMFKDEACMHVLIEWVRLECNDGTFIENLAE